MGLNRTEILKKNLVIHQTILPSFHYRPFPKDYSLCVPNICDVLYVLCMQTAVGISKMKR
jgi:hypothetical protein